MSSRKLVLAEEYDEARSAFANDGGPGLRVAAFLWGLVVSAVQAAEIGWPLVAFGWVVEAVFVIAIARHAWTIRRWRDQEREQLASAGAERVMDVFTLVAARTLTPEEGARLLREGRKS